jgi:hypothetical protein
MPQHRFSRTFTAKDATGKEYAINEFIEYTITRDFNGIGQMDTGYTSLKTPAGHTVSPIQGSPNQLMIFAGANDFIGTTDDAEYIREQST